MSSVKKSIETAESAQAAGAGTGEDAVREAQREAMAPARVAEEGDPNMTEKVTMRLPVNRENPGDNEVVVGLNGRFYKIKRGVTVEVPKAVALILQQSEEQDAATLEMIEAIGTANSTRADAAREQHPTQGRRGEKPAAPDFCKKR